MYGPPYRPCPPYPMVARFQPGVSIQPVVNGWIVTAPAKDQRPEPQPPTGENDDDDDEDPAYGPRWAPKTEQHVFQFDQKDAMLDFVREATPGPS